MRKIKKIKDNKDQTHLTSISFERSSNLAHLIMQHTKRLKLYHLDK